MTNKKNYNFVLIGRSGCGKGTQAKLLQEKFGNFYYLSSGALFRDLSQQDTVAGNKMKKEMKAGTLPFDTLAVALWMRDIAYNLKEDQGLMLDGAPRRLNEAIKLDAFIKWLGREKETFIILLDISRQEAFNRLTKRRTCKSCGRLIPWVGEFKNLKACDLCQGELETRLDDTPEAINNRLDYFEERVVAVIDYFEKKGSLIKVNGDQPIDDVFKDILRAIGEK